MSAVSGSDAVLAATHVESKDEAVEEVVVTGTRIARRDYFSVSPITSFDRKEIELSGNVEIKTLINDMPQVDPGLGSGTGNSDFGSSRVNLRALGDFRTLTLLNGRRFANNTVFGATDLNSLPPVLIERVEVITGGASAVYGSDAMAGAVNFVLRNDFSGLEANAQYGTTEEGDGDTQSIDIAFGTSFADGRGHLALFGSHYERDVVFQDARRYSAVPLWANNGTGEIERNFAFITQDGFIEGSDFYTLSPDGVPRVYVYPDDGFNTASEEALQAPMERYTASAFGHYNINDTIRMSYEVMYARSKPEQRRSGVYFNFVDVNVDRPDIAPELSNLLSDEFDPDGDGIAALFLGRRFTEDRGPVINVNDRTFTRAMLGFTGSLAADWQWSADYSYTDTGLDQEIRNDTSNFRIQQGLLVDPLTGECFDTSGGCVPVNPFGANSLTAGAADYIGLDGVTSDEQVTEQVINLTLRGTVLNSWHNGIDLALGAEYRHDEISFTPSEPMSNGDSVFTGPFPPLDGSLEIREIFAEARVPLLSDLPAVEYLGLELGVRASDYNVVDDTLWTWKVGGEWQIVETVRMRTMAQRAVRVPNIAELFQAPEFAYFDFFLGPVFDQCSASRDPIGNGVADLCVAQGVPVDQIGLFEADFFPARVDFASNPNLDAEEADTFTAGVVWQPDFGLGLSTSIDYFNIEIDNGSTLLFPDDFVPLCFISGDAASDSCSSFTRGATGDIDRALATFVNSASIVSEGIDVTMDFGWEADRIALFDAGASFALSFVATRYLEAGTQASPLVPFVDCSGRFSGACDLDFIYSGALPDFRANTRLTYFSEPLSVSLRWMHIGELLNSENEFLEAIGQPPGMLVVPRIPSQDYFDLTIDSDIGDHWNVRFGVTNLFDEDPPFVGDGNFGSANTNPSTYDTLGRRYFLRLTARL